VYVRPYPEAGLKTQVSADGGIEPVWSRTGRELFFRRGRDVLAAKVSTTPTFSAERATVLFSGDYPFGPIAANYDVSADGTRFLMMKGRQWMEGQLVVVLNWFSESTSSGAPR